MEPPVQQILQIFRRNQPRAESGHWVDFFAVDHFPKRRYWNANQG